MSNREMKDYVPVEKIQPNGTFEHTVGYKPILGSLLLLVFGVAALLMRSAFGYVLGGLVVLMSLIMLFGMKDRKVLDIYSEGVVAYEKGNDSKAVYFTYDMVIEWSVERTAGGTQVVAFLLKGNRYVIKETYRMRGFRNLLKKHMPDTEVITPKRERKY